MPTIYPILGIGQQSKSANLTAQHRVNLFYDVQTDADKVQVAAYGTPGTVLFSTLSGSPTRGMHWMESNNTLYVIQRGDIWAVDGAGSAVLKKSLTTANPTDISGRVSMANNGTELCIVTGSFGYIYNPGTNTLTNITAALPGGADTVAFLDGYFLVNKPNSGQFFKSAAYDGLTWDGLDFATAESNPDNVVAVCAEKGYLAVFGTSSVELWVNAGLQGFPFQRVNGAPSEAGLASRWSLSRCAGMLTGLFRNRQGALTVAQLNGYDVTPVSTPDIDYIINGYTSPTDAVGFGYSLDGRAFYQITFQSDGASWLWDHGSGQWSMLKSRELQRHVGDLYSAFDNKSIISDYENGNLYYLSNDAVTDNGYPIAREIIGKHVTGPSRNNIIIRRLRLEMEGGVGTISSQGADPQIMLQVSRDGGHTWGGEMWTKIGMMGQYTSRAEWRRLGISRDWVFKIRLTDPVKCVIIYAVIEAQEANK